MVVNNVNENDSELRLYKLNALLTSVSNCTSIDMKYFKDETER